MGRLGRIATGAGLLLAGALGAQIVMPSASAQSSTDPAFNQAAMSLSAAVATPVPTTCTTGRSAIALYNHDSAAIYYGDANVSDSGATRGFVCGSGETCNVTVSCNASRTPTVYAYSAAGCTNCLTYGETK